MRNSLCHRAVPICGFTMNCCSSQELKEGPLPTQLIRQYTVFSSGQSPGAVEEWQNPYLHMQHAWERFEV